MLEEPEKTEAPKKTEVLKKATPTVHKVSEQSITHKADSNH